MGDPDGHDAAAVLSFVADALDVAGAGWTAGSVALPGVLGGGLANIGINTAAGNNYIKANATTQEIHASNQLAMAKAAAQAKAAGQPTKGSPAPGTQTGTQTPGQQGATPPPPPTNPTGPNQPKSNPMEGTPGGTSTTTHPDGSTKQTRTYGPDGYPQTDVDHGHDHGQGDPHAHDWGRPPGGGAPTDKDRGTGRPLKPEDPK